MKEIGDTIKLLRLPFSIFLLPVTLFSFYYIKPGFSFSSVLVFLTWHVLVFPSSNGYNSWNDKDTGPIGSLAKPPQPPSLLLHVCNVMDLLALAASLYVSLYFFICVAGYIIASRLYSSRGVRLKKYPVIGFLIVFIFQGAWIFSGNVLALSGWPLLLDNNVVTAAITTSFFVGTVYPLTQIYQHQQDNADGVKTLSMLLGIKGTFIFSGLMFLIVSLLIARGFSNEPRIFFLFNVVMLLSALYFMWWAIVSFKNSSRVNFKNAMIMLVLASLSNNIFFIILLNK
jgi:1,4-dihydroxy-2-naphthoate octaprenyltransferase